MSAPELHVPVAMPDVTLTYRARVVRVDVETHRLHLALALDSGLEKQIVQARLVGHVQRLETASRGDARDAALAWVVESLNVFGEDAAWPFVAQLYPTEEGMLAEVWRVLDHEKLGVALIDGGYAATLEAE